MTRTQSEDIYSIVQSLAKEPDWRYPYHFERTRAGAKILAMSPPEQVSLAVAITERLVYPDDWRVLYYLQQALFNLLSQKLPLTHNDLLLVFTSLTAVHPSLDARPDPGLLFKTQPHPKST